MPQLQLHMLRVAGVAFNICNFFNKPINKDLIISASLLHDMGNIVKAKFDIFPDEFYKPRGREYWKRLQKEFIEKYGNDDHTATEKILRESGISLKIVTLLSDMKFKLAEKVSLSKDFNLKIVSYADQRVSPYGVVSMKKRFDEAKKRYVNDINHELFSKEFDFLVTKSMENEKQIFTNCSIRPEDINDSNVMPLLDKLRVFDIPSKF